MSKATNITLVTLIGIVLVSILGVYVYFGVGNAVTIHSDVSNNLQLIKTTGEYYQHKVIITATPESVSKGGSNPVLIRVSAGQTTNYPAEDLQHPADASREYFIPESVTLNPSLKVYDGASGSPRDALTFIISNEIKGKGCKLTDSTPGFGSSGRGISCELEINIRCLDSEVCYVEGYTGAEVIVNIPKKQFEAQYLEAQKIEKEVIELKSETQEEVTMESEVVTQEDIDTVNEEIKEGTESVSEIASNTGFSEDKVNFILSLDEEGLSKGIWALIIGSIVTLVLLVTLAVVLMRD